MYSLPKFLLKCVYIQSIVSALSRLGKVDSKFKKKNEKKKREENLDYKIFII